MANKFCKNGIIIRLPREVETCELKRKSENSGKIRRHRLHNLNDLQKNGYELVQIEKLMDFLLRSIMYCNAAGPLRS